RMSEMLPRKPPIVLRGFSLSWRTRVLVIRESTYELARQRHKGQQKRTAYGMCSRILRAKLCLDGAIRGRCRHLVRCVVPAPPNCFETFTSWRSRTLAGGDETRVAPTWPVGKLVLVRVLTERAKDDHGRRHR